MARGVVLFCEEYARGAFVADSVRSGGYTPHWASSIEAVFQLAERGDARVLIADARSADVLPWLVAGWRRRVWPGGRVVLLARSNEASDYTELADEVLSSPLSRQALREALERAMREGIGA